MSGPNFHPWGSKNDNLIKLETLSLGYWYGFMSEKMNILSYFLKWQAEVLFKKYFCQACKLKNQLSFLIQVKTMSRGEVSSWFCLSMAAKHACLIRMRERTDWDMLTSDLHTKAQFPHHYQVLSKCIWKN